MENRCDLFRLAIELHLPFRLTAIASEVKVLDAWIERESETKKMNVLLVEDEKLMNWSLAKCLSRWGFEVSPVFTGQDALGKLQMSSYDIVVLDYQLPDLNGLEVA